MANDSMRDPRLAELEFLSAIARGDIGQARYPNDSKEETFGLPAEPFKQMVMHLAINGLINDLADLHMHRDDDWQSSLTSQLNTFLTQFQEHQPVFVRLNHKGWLRLWSLKEEMASESKLEPQFGILLLGRYWPTTFDLAFIEKKVPVSVLIGDLDHFKEVNDTLGHLEGDKLLVEVFHELRDTTGDAGRAYRLKSGDEVLVLLPAMDQQKATAFAEILRGNVEERLRTAHVDGMEKLKNRPTMTIGGITFTKRVHPRTAEKMVDKVMYRGKPKGGGRGNCVEWGSENASTAM